MTQEVPAEVSDEDLVDHLLDLATPRTETVPVCVRGDLVEQHIALTESLAAVLADGEGSIAGDPRVDQIRESLDALQAAQAEATQEFKLRSIGPLAYQNLLRTHLPRPGQDHRLAFNLETFPPALVAACSTAPQITEAQAIRMYGTDAEAGLLHAAEWDKLWAAAFTLNELETPRPKLPAAIEALLRSERSSSSAAPAASPAPSSSAESAEPSPSSTTPPAPTS